MAYNKKGKGIETLRLFLIIIITFSYLRFKKK